MANARHKWLPIVQQWLASGLTADQFAAQQGCKAATLRYWKSILSRSGQTPLPQPPASEHPLPLELQSSLPLIELRTSPPVPDHCFELELPSGGRLRIPFSFDASSLRRLLGVLEPQP